MLHLLIKKKLAQTKWGYLDAVCPAIFSFSDQLHDEINFAGLVVNPFLLPNICHSWGSSKDHNFISRTETWQHKKNLSKTNDEIYWPQSQVTLKAQTNPAVQKATICTPTAYCELRLPHKDEELTKSGVSLLGTCATTSKIQMPWFHSDSNTRTSCSYHGDYPFSIEALQEDTEDLALAIRLQSLTRSDWACHEHEIQQGETSSPSLEVGTGSRAADLCTKNLGFKESLSVLKSI